MNDEDDLKETIKNMLHNNQYIQELMELNHDHKNSWFSQQVEYSIPKLPDVPTVGDVKLKDGDMLLHVTAEGKYYAHYAKKLTDIKSHSLKSKDAFVGAFADTLFKLFAPATNIDFFNDVLKDEFKEKIQEVVNGTIEEVLDSHRVGKEKIRPNKI